MGKYFGTDGVRGRANATLTYEMAIQIGRYIGWYYTQKKNEPANIVIGKDTRKSSDMFEMALATGITASGANAYLLGVCPTPSVSYLVRKEQMDCGVMVSASHNPYYDNGIKLFNGSGKKMDAEIEQEIEAFMDHKQEIPLAKDAAIGSCIDWKEKLKVYQAYIMASIDHRLDGMKVLVDGANGSATSCAKEVLTGLGAQVDVIHYCADGININTNCGSTHPQDLQAKMKQGSYDIGIAFDGDADRLIIVDEKGNLLSGDHFLFICGKYLKSQNRLKDQTVVTTVMANLGLYKAFEKEGIQTKQTAVGDKYVFECMDQNKYVLGGEQSGHIIFYEFANTGDGLLSAVQLLSIQQQKQVPVSQLYEGLFIYPQILKNHTVKDKQKVMQDQGLQTLIKEVETSLQGEGRVLVRASGTEPLIRVMIEAKSDALCELYANQFIDYINTL